MSQESEQAQGAWRRKALFEYGEPAVVPFYLDGQKDLKAALKAEIEDRIQFLERLPLGLNDAERAELKSLKWFLSLLDTVKPIK